MSVTQTVEVPADHRLVIDVPSEIPAGQVILTFTPKPVLKNGERGGFGCAKTVIGWLMTLTLRLMASRTICK